MIKSKLIIENHTRDYFCDEYTDEFELLPLENQSDVFDFKHNGCNIATLDKDQLKELANYIQMMIQ